MNEITTTPNLDNDKIAALMAELHADATREGEAAPQEGAFVSDDADEATTVVAPN